MNFEFATSARIIFGIGTVRGLPGLARQWGERLLVALGAQTAQTEAVLENLVSAGLQVDVLRVKHEPSVSLIEGSLERARSAQVFIGLGGGSALDTAKALAALAANSGQVGDYLELVGKGQPLDQPSRPCIAVPTTAGTGAEVTRNAVLSVPGQRIKVSLRSAGMLPRLAIVDPELTYGMPPEVTAAAGLDALTQLIEPFLSRFANPLVDGFCREGIRQVVRSIRPAYHLDDEQAREGMSLAALLGGLALANARLGAVHGLAGVLGGWLDSDANPAPHGALCAALLPHVLQSNYHAVKERQPQNPAMDRMAELAGLLTGLAGAPVEAGLNWIDNLVAEMRVPSLAQYGLLRADFKDVAARAQRSSSMQGNPLPLADDELFSILEKAL